MNPWALLIILLGILLVIVGVKGSQHSIVAAITGHSASGASSGSSSSSASAPAPIPRNLTPGMPDFTPGKTS